MSTRAAGAAAHDVRAEHPGALHRGPAVGRLADHLDGLVAGQHRAQAGPHQAVVVDQQHPHRAHGTATSAYGSRARSRNTDPATSAAKSPPSRVARSRMPTMPCPPGPRPAAPAATRLVTASSTASGPYRSSTRAAPAPCRVALVSASWRIRYAAQATLGGSPPGAGGTDPVTRSPPARC